MSRFHEGFNKSFDRITNKYKKGVEHVVNHRIITTITVAVGIIALVLSMEFTSTGLVPDEDTGTLFVMISAAPGTGQERTKEITVDRMLANNPAVEHRQAIYGYNFIAGQGSDQATFVVKLKPFEERSNGFFDKIKGLFTGDPLRFFVNPKESKTVLGMIYKQTGKIKDAQILAFAPPMIPGFSVSNGVAMTLQDWW